MAHVSSVLTSSFYIISNFRCNDNYKGSRCEQFQLLQSSTNAEEAGLIAALVTVALLILVVVAVIIYCVRK